jgi:hypothetical protein
MKKPSALAAPSPPRRLAQSPRAKGKMKRLYAYKMEMDMPGGEASRT